MSFLDEARGILGETVPEIFHRTEGYVPRTLVREDIDRQEAVQLRSLRRLGLPEAERKLLPDVQITSCPRLAIIGDAGSGKSYVLQSAYLGAAYTFLNSSDAPLPCFLDLARHLSIQHNVEETLAEALNRRYRGLFLRLRSEHRPGCILFLDALDERLLTEKNHYDFANGLFSFFKDYQDLFHSVVLTCRRVAWNPNWLHNSDTPWEVYHADYLDFEDYAHIIPDPTTREAFFNQVDSLGIADLLRLPFIGFDLARKYNQGQSLPASRQDWFQERTEVALKGSERDQERGQSLPIGTLLLLTRQLACLATFGRMTSWTVQEATDQLGASKILRQEQGPITYEHIQTLFRRPLFTRTDGRFSFSHQLFREYLAAEALSSLPLRKQRQLLETALPSLQHRILTPFRGVAIFLTETSSIFRENLIENDPLVAFLTDLPSLLPDLNEKLAKMFIDKAIADHRAPWWEIPPRGERPIDFLPKHRPSDVAGFLRPYLERSDTVSLLWATACAAAWGGSTRINNWLIRLAHNNELDTEIRTNAVDAVLAAGKAEDIRRLYNLLDSADDSVRGHVLRAYRMTDSPAPRDYIVKLRGGAHDESLVCLLQYEVSSYGLSLDLTGLKEAFQVISSYLADIGDLLPELLQGLFQRALGLGFDDIPPSLIVNLWLGHNPGAVHYEEELKKVVSSSSQLFSRIWSYILHELDDEDSGFFYTSDLAGSLAEVCDDQILDLVPENRSLLNQHQDALVSGVLRWYFLKDPIAERLQVFKSKAPAYATHFQIPEPDPDVVDSDPLDSEQKLVGILGGEEESPCRRTFRILEVLIPSLQGQNHYWIEPTYVIGVIEKLAASLRQDVLKTFEACVLNVRYSRVSLPQEDGTHKTQWTSPLYAAPFWVARRFGMVFPAYKIDEIIRCYAFSDFPPNGPGPEMYFRLLDELYSLDLARWSDTIFWLTECPDVHLSGPMEYLASRESDLYVGTCRQRLKSCDFTVGDFNPLLNYWIARRPPDYETVVRTCYECSDREEDRTELLHVLLTEDSDWAWEEISHRIDAGNPPRRESSFPRRPLRLPRNPLRLPVLADWYAHLRRTRDEAGDDWRPGDIEHLLKETIIAIGGEDAIVQLKRLQQEKAFPGAEWLSGSILQIEDQMLSAIETTMEPGQLIDFVNRDALGVVLNERDLFEWVCQAIGDIQERLERQAAQVHGYWNRHGEEWEPKTEPECQNVFWPTVQDRLVNLGIVGVEETPIRAHRVDFWVEKPLDVGQSARVAIELKVARKGYGYRDLVEPLETQLWQKYLEPSGCRHGIHVVLWFKDRARYPYPTSWETLSELLEQLDDLRHQIMEQRGVNLACYVIDLTTVTRMH